MDAQNLIARIRATGNTPDSAYIAKRCGITEEEANELLHMDIQALSPDIKKVARTRTKRNTEHTKPDSPAPIQKAVPIVQEVAKDPKSLRERVQGLLLAILPIILFLASVAGSMRSYTLAKGFFLRINNEFDATVFAILLVSLSFSIPQAIPLLWPEVRKGKRIAMFTLSVILSIATVGANGLISTQELFSQRSDALTGVDANESKRTQLLSSIADSEKALVRATDSMRIDEEERRILMEAQKGLEVGSVAHNRVRNNLSEIRGRIDNLSNRISELDAEIRKIRAELATIPPQTGAKVSSEMEMAINVGIAFILEFGAPTALALSMYL